MINMTPCPFCDNQLVLAGSGWLCVNPHCANAGNLVEGDNSNDKQSS